MSAATEFGNLALLPTVLRRANDEILGVLASLRRSRSALEHATVERLQHTHEKLREVTSATEVAATDILDALDRAQGMLDELDGEPDGQSERAVGIRATLREEIFGMMGALQFQDITTQQLSYASAVLVEMEQRLCEIAGIFDGHSAAAHEGVAALPLAPDPQSYDRGATTQNAGRRQALADEIFVTPAE